MHCYVNLKEYSVILLISFYDMNQKIINKWLLPKFQLIPILHLQVMYDFYVHCFIDYDVMN